MRIVWRLILLDALMLGPRRRAQDAAADFSQPADPHHRLGAGRRRRRHRHAHYRPGICRRSSASRWWWRTAPAPAGNLGAEFVFTSPPDGYTLLASQPSPITVNPMLYKKMRLRPDASSSRSRS